jgi:hypothetical protein
MNGLPREAREELLRAWLGVLRDRHPEVTWIAVDTNGNNPPPFEEEDETQATTPELQAVA